MADFGEQGFVHLRVRSAYSLLEGAIKADAIGELAAKAGMPAAALTDRTNLFGALEYSVATKEAGVQPIIGVALAVYGIGEGQPERWARVPTVVLLAQNEQGYLNLSALSSSAYLDGGGEAEPSGRLPRADERGDIGRRGKGKDGEEDGLGGEHHERDRQGAVAGELRALEREDLHNK